MGRNILVGSLIVTLGFASVLCLAEDVVVPDAVKTAFAEKYKDVTGVKWEKENEDGKTVFEAGWKNKDDMKQEVEFDEKGAVVLVAHEVKVDQLPKAVTDAVTKAYPGSKLKSSMMEEGKTTVYEVTIHDAADKKITLDVSPDGSSVKVDAD